MNKQQFLEQSKNKSERQILKYINVDLKKSSSLDTMQQVINELLASPIVREQRYGVILAVAFKDSSSVIQCLSHEHCLISSTAAAKVTAALNDEQLKQVALDEKLPPFVRRLIHKDIKRNRKSLIAELVPAIAKSFTNTEAISLLGSLPTDSNSRTGTEPSESDKQIVQLLESLNVNRIQYYGVIARRHPIALLRFIENQWQKLKKGSDLELMNDFLSKNNLQLSEIASIRPDLIIDLIDRWIVTPATERKQEVHLPSIVSSKTQALLIEQDKFVDLLIRSMSSNGEIKQYGLLPISFHNSETLRRISVENLVKIWNATISKTGYKTSEKSGRLVNSFLVCLPQKNTYDLARSRKFYSTILQTVDRNQFAAWIANNIKAKESLICLDPSVASQVASILLEREKKKTTFVDVSQETDFWQYIVDNVSDDNKYAEFKAKTSNPDPNVRARVLTHLITCSLYHNKKVTETLEYLVKRLNNERAESFQTFVEALNGRHLNYIYISRSPNFTARATSSQTNRELIAQLVNLTAQKNERAASTYLSYLITAPKEEAFEFAVKLPTKSTPFDRYIQQLSNRRWEILLQTYESAMESAIKKFNSRKLSPFFSMLQYEHCERVSKFLEKLFTETIKSISSKPSSPCTQLIGLVDVWLSKAKYTAEERLEKVRQLLKYDASFIQSAVVQRVMLGPDNSDYSLLKEYLQPKPISYQELAEKSSAPLLLTLDENVKFHHLNPTIIRELRACKYLPEPIMKDILHMLTLVLSRALNKTFETMSPIAPASLEEGGVLSEYHDKASILKAIIKSLGHIAVEKDEIEIVNASVTSFVSSVTLENATESTQEPDSAEEHEDIGANDEEINEHVEQEDIGANDEEINEHVEQEEGEEADDQDEANPAALEAAVGLAKVVSASLPTNHMEHLEYLLQNVESKFVLYFISAIRRVCQKLPLAEFMPKFLGHLETKFLEVSQQDKSTPAPKNFGISIQKMYVTFLIDFAKLPQENIWKQRIYKLIADIWKLSPHKDVQVSIVHTAITYVSEARQVSDIKNLENILVEGVSSEYTPVVVEAVSFGNRDFASAKVAQWLFAIQIKALKNTEGVTQRCAWVKIMQVINDSLYFAQLSASEEYDFVNMISESIQSVVLTFDPIQNHNLSDQATLPLQQLVTRKPEFSSTAFEKIVKPLFAEDLQKIDDQYNRSEEWDLPVTQRRKKLIDSLTEFVYNQKAAGKLLPDAYQTIKDQLLVPIRELLIKKSPVELLVTHLALLFTEITWTSDESVIEGLKQLANETAKVDAEIRSAIAIKQGERLTNYLSSVRKVDSSHMLALSEKLLDSSDRIQQFYGYCMCEFEGKELEWPEEARELSRQFRSKIATNHLIALQSEFSHNN